MASAISVKIRCAYLCLNAVRCGYQRPLSFRHELTSAGRILNAANFSSSGSRFSDKGEDQNSDPKPQNDVEKTERKTAQGNQPGTERKELNLAKPRGNKERKKKKEVQKKTDAVNFERETETMAKALPGNQAENRQELIAKLQQMSFVKSQKSALGSRNEIGVSQVKKKGPRKVKMEKQESDSDPSDSSILDDEVSIKEELKEASEIVAKVLPTAVAKSHESQIRRIKMRLAEEDAAQKNKETRASEETKTKAPKERKTEQSTGKTKRISDLIEGIKVQSHKSPSQAFKDMREDKVKKGGKKTSRNARNQQNSRRRPISTNHLYDGPPLAIFTEDGAPLKNLQDSEPNFFDVLEGEIQVKQMELPPMTAYQEMMEWTKQNKTWQFPIDNEWGMDEEAQVGFHEHVFLSHLITDFPKGPIRHYMELVATGLSKNPHMTAQEKHGHIEWYRQYFADKQKLVDELLETEMA